MKKNFYACFMFILVALFIPLFAIEASATSVTLDDLKKAFPEGAYWNHVVQSGHGYANDTIHYGANCGDVENTYTWSPCTTHNGIPGVGAYDCNCYAGSLQCCGFAKKLANKVYGGVCTSWTAYSKNAAVSVVKAGDVIHYYGNGADSIWGHWVFVIGVSGSNVTVGECNWSGRCKISWVRSFNLNNTSSLTLYSAPSTLTISSVYTGSEMTSGAGQTIPDGDYEIIPAAAPSFMLDISGNAVPAANETNVTIWGRGNDARSQDVFTVTYQSNGFYKIKQKGTDMCLDVYGASKNEGINVQMYQSNSTSAQFWSIARMDTEDGSCKGYSLQAKCSGLYLDINGGLSANGGKFVDGQNVQQWRGNNSSAQCWQFIPYQPQYTVTLNANGGGGSPTSIQVTYGGTYSNLPTPTRGGYSFDGWYTDDGSLVTNSTSVSTASNHTLHARWTHLCENLGDDFYAFIIQKSAWRHIENAYGNVQVASNGNDSCDPKQIWHFIRQSNGSYKIINEYDGTCLDASNWGTVNGTNVGTFENYDSTAQLWFIFYDYANGGGYRLCPSYCNLALDVYGGNMVGGTNIQLYEQSGSLAQTFEVYHLTNDGVNYASLKPSAPNNPTITVSSIGGEVSISWTESALKNQFDYRTYSVDVFAGSFVSDIPVVTQSGLTNRSINTILDSGTYTIRIRSHNAKYKNLFSDVTQTFTVTKEFTVTLNANGGGGSPSSIQVTYGGTYSNLPTPYCTGYTFTGWYTDGGTLVTTSTTVTTASNHTLYARWVENQYTVTLDAKGGGVYPTSIQVTFWGTYSDLPTPYCTGYTFTGWYTEDGSLVTNSTVLTTPSNHTLYAHWTETAVSGITLDKTSIEVVSGDCFTLTATVAPADALDKTVTWSSSNTSVATVDSGVVTAVDSGTATITATAGNKNATCAVIVYYEGSEMTIGAGQTIPDGDYEIVVAAAPSFQLNIALDIVPVPDETNVNIWQRSDPARVVDVFTVTYLNNGFYSIKQKGTDVALDVYNLTNREAKREETNVQMFQFHGGTNQQWSIAKTSNGNYTIQAKSSGLCLDISGGNIQNGQNIQQYRANNTAAQDWQFVPYITSCTISDLTPIDADGQPLDAIPRGAFCVRTTVRKPTDEDVTVILASYDEDGRFAGFVSQTVAGAAGDSVEVSFSMDNTDGSVAHLKAFSVASFDNPMPLGEAASY